ncbi:MAG: sugar ABC transporter permease [Lachnospiraceae bacterium]|nr:sugar ABC transporter permease [Lachnospiraceae bacterium]
MNQSRGLAKRIYRARQLYLILALPLIYLLVFKYYPMLGLQIAFKDYSITGGIWGSEWAGFKYFEKLFKDYNFKKIMINTLRLSLYSLGITTIMPVILALAINCVNNTKIKKAVQTITYLPHFVSLVVMVGIMNQLFNPIVGLYGNVMQQLTGERPVDIFGIPQAFLHMYVWSGVWQHAGYNAVIYIAALAGSDQELHEAAQIDGASRLQRVFYIDIPTILPTVIIMLILNVGRVMGIGFEKAFLMQNALNQSYSEIISTYVYKKAFGAAGNFSYSTAIGLFNSVINFILIIAVNKISKKVSETSLW